jgi:hypothetical protein
MSEMPAAERENARAGKGRPESMKARRRRAAPPLHDVMRELRGRGMITKVMAKEVIAFGVAFALSLAVSVTVVELIWGLIYLREQQIATGHPPVIAELGKR